MLDGAHQRAQTSNLRSSPRVLVISQPNTPGQRPLPGTLEEVRQIKACLGRHDMKWLNEGDATIQAVLEGMGTYSWCHLACHGIQHREDPMKSSFALYDGSLELQTIMSKSFPSAEVAFLSACQTASGDEALPEEAVHLAAGMLAAGYQTVFGTMWSIGDKDAPVLAKEIYPLLLDTKNDDGIDDSRRAAYALHHAVGKLREKVGENSFVQWVPFVHFGI